MTEKENKDSQRINKVAPVSDAGENPNTVAAAKPEKKRKKESFEVIKGYATRECGSLVVGAIFLIGAILSDLATPYYIGKVIDLLQKGDFDGIGELSIYMLIVILVSGICVGFRAAIFNILSERISRNLRKDFYESLMYKDIAFFDANRTGDLISRLNSDVQVV